MGIVSPQKSIQGWWEKNKQISKNIHPCKKVGFWCEGGAGGAGETGTNSHHRTYNQEKDTKRRNIEKSKDCQSDIM